MDKSELQVLGIGLVKLYDYMKELNQNSGELKFELEGKEITFKIQLFEKIKEKNKCQ